MIFSQRGVEEIERDFSRIEVLPEHRKMLQQVVRVLQKYINISELALMGFAWKSIKQWQIDHKMTAKEITLHGTPEEKANAVKEMMEHVGDNLKRILRKESDTGLIDKAIQDAFQYYMTNIQNKKLSEFRK